jgi:hypothetical protein
LSAGICSYRMVELIRKLVQGVPDFVVRCNVREPPALSRLAPDECPIHMPSPRGNVGACCASGSTNARQSRRSRNYTELTARDCTALINRGQASIERGLNLVARASADTGDARLNSPGYRSWTRAFEVSGRQYISKIHYGAPDMMHGAHDPSNPLKTVRMLTIGQ